MTTMDFENALVDVRKAYRLIYLYQRRVMDVVQFLADSLAFRYAGGWSWFSENTPKEGKGSLDNWAWDWINMYFYEFNLTSTESEKSNINFSILIQSDTGFFDSDSNNKLNIESFTSAEQSSTRFIFLIGKNCWHTDFEKDFETTSMLFKKDTPVYIKKLDDKILLAKTFHLTNFMNLETSLKSLEDFVFFCNSNGIIEIEYQNKF